MYCFLRKHVILKEDFEVAIKKVLKIDSILFFVFKLILILRIQSLSRIHYYNSNFRHRYKQTNKHTKRFHTHIYIRVKSVPDLIVILSVVTKV